MRTKCSLLGVFTLMAVGVLALSASSAAAGTVQLNSTGAPGRGAPADGLQLEPSVQLSAPTSCGCGEDATGFVMSYANIPVGVTWHTQVIVNGVTYMDEEFVSYNGTGTHPWHIYYANQGGTATGTWPLPSGHQITIILTTELPLGHVVAGWQTVLDGCDNCNVVSSHQYSGHAVPTTSAVGLIALAALLLLAGVFTVLRLRA